MIAAATFDNLLITPSAAVAAITYTHVTSSHLPPFLYDMSAL